MSSRARKILKHTAMLLFTIMLLIDLADDGCFGKTEPATPLCPGTGSLTPSGSSGKAESSVWIPPARLPVIRQRWQNQSILVEIECPFTRINCYFLGSSGGIPL
jgi:hypothetical protein